MKKMDCLLLKMVFKDFGGFELYSYRITVKFLLYWLYNLGRSLELLLV